MADVSCGHDRCGFQCSKARTSRRRIQSFAAEAAAGSAVMLPRHQSSAAVSVASAPAASSICSCADGSAIRAGSVHAARATAACMRRICRARHIMTRRIQANARACPHQGRCSCSIIYGGCRQHTARPFFAFASHTSSSIKGVQTGRKKRQTCSEARVATTAGRFWSSESGSSASIAAAAPRSPAASDSCTRMSAAVGCTSGGASASAASASAVCNTPKLILPSETVADFG